MTISNKRSGSGSRGRSVSQPGIPVLGISKPIKNLADFLTVCSGFLTGTNDFWFRGHASQSWELIPSALRFPDPEMRERALGLLSEFKRVAKMRLQAPPDSNNDFEWLLLARHYGLPTRLLDWTMNVAAALYFACSTEPTEDGSVVILNPCDLNMEADSEHPEIYDPLSIPSDRTVVERYLRLGHTQRKNGRRTIAVHPVWNSERIIVQKGTFTLHGTRSFKLDNSQVESLCSVTIPARAKGRLLQELGAIGTDEMSLFPEAEHICKYLMTKAGLFAEGGLSNG